MKANELMIGDILSVVPSGCLIQVAAIHGKKIGYHDCTDKLSWVRIGLVRPIRITPEILEKNGFRKFQQFPDYPIPQWSLKELSHVRIELKEKDDECVIEYSARDEEIVLNVRYVQELQHALRLCGTNKEIKL